MSAASAVGNAKLQPFLLTNPVPTWKPLPTSEVQQIVTSYTKGTSTVTSQKVEVAANGFGGPGSGALFIVLERFPTTPLTSAQIRTGLDDNCTANGQKTGVIVPVPGVPNSQSETCKATSGLPIVSAGWIQGNTVPFLESEGLGSALLDQVANEQAAKIPSNGIDAGGSSSSSSIDGVIGVVVVAAIVVGIVLARRRSKAQVAPAVAGQWVAPGAAAPPWGGAPQGVAGGGAPYAAPPAAYPGNYAPGPEAGVAYPAASDAYPAAPSGYQAGSGFGEAAPPAASTGPAPYQPARPSETPYEPASASRPFAGSTPFVGGNDATQIDSPAGTNSDVGGEPGWQPVEGDPNRQRYWDGTAWTSYLRWDGTSWVNDS
jgi:hypothetical protein